MTPTPSPNLGHGVPATMESREERKASMRRRKVSRTFALSSNVQDIPKSYSFAAAGWLKMYYFGVAKALQQAGIHHGACFAGASAGTLVSTALILDCDFDAIRDFALECLDRTHGDIRNMFKLRDFVRESIERLMPNQPWERTREKLEGRLEVSVTILPYCTNVRITKFPTREFLIQALLASCCATPIAGFPFYLEGYGWVFDGGLTDFQPMIDEDSVTVSPVYFHRADIRPTLFTPLWWGAYPATRKEFLRLFDLGYCDTVDWMMGRGLITEPTPGHLKVHETVGKMKGKKIAKALKEHMELSEINDKMRPDHIEKNRGFIGNSLSIVMDVIFLVILLLVVRPITVALLFVELSTVTTVALFKAVLHDVLPTFSGRTRIRAWRDLYNSLMTQADVRIYYNTLFGSHVHYNRERLVEHSFVYRVFQFAV